MSDDDERRLRLREASYLHSSSREALIEHVFVAGGFAGGMVRPEQLVDVLRSEVDAAGYDIVFERGSILRQVQLKASESSGKTSRQTINTRLSEQPGGCVVWVSTANGSRTIASTFPTYGSAGNPGEPLPNLGHLVGRNPRSKTPRPGTRLVTRARFERVASTAELVERLFGPPPSA